MPKPNDHPSLSNYQNQGFVDDTQVFAVFFVTEWPENNVSYFGKIKYSYLSIVTILFYCKTYICSFWNQADAKLTLIFTQFHCISDKGDPRNCDTFLHHCPGEIRSNVWEQTDNSQTAGWPAARGRGFQGQRSSARPRGNGWPPGLPRETSGVLRTVVPWQHMWVKIVLLG